MDLEYLCDNQEHFISGFDYGYEKIESYSFFSPDDVQVAYIRIDGSIIKVMEDPNDGLRSSLGKILKPSERHIFHNIFQPNPVFVKNLSEYNDYSFSGYQFIDVFNNKPILIVGTENWDDWYPTYVCKWMPENMGINKDS